MARGDPAAVQKASQPAPALLRNTADSGINTIRPSHAMVMPSDSENPGIAERVRAERVRRFAGAERSFMQSTAVRQADEPSS